MMMEDGGFESDVDRKDIQLLIEINYSGVNEQ